MKIELKGYNLDNLIKQLYIKKVKIYNLFRYDQNHISFDIKDKDYKKIRRYIANYKVKQSLSYFRRLPKLLLTNIGVVIGVFIGMLFGIIANNYTWQILIYGTQQLSKTEIIQVLKQNGIKVGGINRQTSKQIETILLNKYDRLAQVSVIKQGTAIIINLSEKLVYVDATYQPICAKYAGIIEQIDVVTGTLNVKVGDYVNVGDILVLPFNIDSNGQKVNVKPEASIQSKNYVTNIIKIPKTEYVFKPTGKCMTIYRYKIFGFNLFFGKRKNSFDIFNVASYNEFVSDLIPLKREVTIYSELKGVYVDHDLLSLVDQTKQDCITQALNLIPTQAELIETNATCHIDNDILYAYAIITFKGSNI